MKEVIYITEKKENKVKPVEFTHRQDESGWKITSLKPNMYGDVVYLGKCTTDGDMFAGYFGDSIIIFKGHLNSGKY